MSVTPRRTNINALRFTPISPSQWQSDDSTDVCTICRQQFTLFNRKHHCRRDGRVVCSTCSNYTLPTVYNDTVVYDDTDTFQRVCIECYQTVINQAKQKQASTPSMKRYSSASGILQQSNTQQSDRPALSQHTASNNNNNKFNETNNYSNRIAEWRNIQLAVLLYSGIATTLATIALHYQHSCVTGTTLLLYSAALVQIALVTILLLPVYARNELLNTAFDIYQSFKTNKQIHHTLPVETPTVEHITTNDAKTTEPVPDTQSYTLPPVRKRRGYKAVDSTVAQRLIKQANATVNTMWGMATTDDGWTQRKCKNDVNLCCKTIQSRTVFKAFLVIDNITPKQLFDFMHDDANDKQWNENLHEMIKLQTLNDTTEICYTCTKTVAGVVSGRDFISVATHKQIEQSYVICSASITETDYINENNAVRGINNGGFIQLATDHANTVKLVAIFDCQLLGWLSQSLVDSLADDVIIQLMLKIQECVKQHYATQSSTTTDLNKATEIDAS